MADYVPFCQHEEHGKRKEIWRGCLVTFGLFYNQATMNRTGTYLFIHPPPICHFHLASLAVPPHCFQCVNKTQIWRQRTLLSIYLQSHPAPQMPNYSSSINIWLCQDGFSAGLFSTCSKLQCFSARREIHIASFAGLSQTFPNTCALYWFHWKVRARSGGSVVPFLLQFTKLQYRIHFVGNVTQAG